MIRLFRVRLGSGVERGGGTNRATGKNNENEQKSY
jgi:hypothetical protein